MALEWTAEDDRRIAKLRGLTDRDEAHSSVAGVLEIEHNAVRLTVEELRELATMATTLADKAEQ